MKYYGYTKEHIDKMMALFNMISVTGMGQIDAYHEAITILRHPAEINTAQKEGESDGQSIQ